MILQTSHIPIATARGGTDTQGHRYRNMEFAVDSPFYARLCTVSDNCSRAGCIRCGQGTAFQRMAYYGHDHGCAVAGSRSQRVRSLKPPTRHHVGVAAWSMTCVQ